MTSLISLIVFLLLLLHVPYSSGWFDSGEFIAASWGLGIAHNPGYPIYLIAAKFWSLLIPLGSIPFRMHLLSLALSVVSILLLGHSAHRISHGSRMTWIGVTCIGTGFLWSSILRTQSTTNEVYPLDLLFFSLTLFVVLKLQAKWSFKNLCLFFLTSSLALVNHYSAVTWLPVLLLWFPFKRLLTLSAPRIIICLMLCILSLSCFIYLPLRSSTSPILDWGNTRTVTHFSDHILARSHRTMSMPTLSLPQRLDRFVEFLTHIRSTSPGGLWGVLIAAWIGCFRFAPRIGIAGLLIFISHSAYVCFLNVVPFEATPFGIPILAIALVCLSIAIQKGLPVRISQYTVLGLVCVGSVISCTRIDPDIGWARHLASTVLNRSRPQALVMTYSDSLTFNLLAIQACERLREDVVVISDLYPNLILNEALPSTSANTLTHCLGHIPLSEGSPPVWDCLANQMSQPVYRELRPGSNPNNLHFQIDGILWRLESRHQPPPSPRDIERFVSFYRHPAQDPISRNVAATFLNTLGLFLESWQQISAAQATYREAVSVLPVCGEALVNLGLIAYRSGEIESALQFMTLARDVTPRLAAAHRNIGLILLRKNDLKGARNALLQAHALEPLPPPILDVLGQIDQALGTTSITTQ